MMVTPLISLTVTVVEMGVDEMGTHRMDYVKIA